MMLTNLYVSNIGFCKRNNQLKKIKNIPIKNRNKLNIIGGEYPLIEITGKFLGTFVLFASTLNWMHYRDLRKRYEEHNKKDEKDKDK